MSALTPDPIAQDAPARIPHQGGCNCESELEHVELVARVNHSTLQEPVRARLRAERTSSWLRRQVVAQELWEASRGR